MWRHPITAKQIRVLAEDWGVKEEPIPAPEGEVGSSEGEGWFQVIRVRLPLPVALGSVLTVCSGQPISKYVPGKLCLPVLGRMEDKY